MWYADLNKRKRNVSIYLERQLFKYWTVGKTSVVHFMCIYVHIYIRAMNRNLFDEKSVILSDSIFYPAENYRCLQTVLAIYCGRRHRVVGSDRQTARGYMRLLNLTISPIFCAMTGGRTCLRTSDLSAPFRNLIIFFVF